MKANFAIACVLVACSLFGCTTNVEDPTVDQSADNDDDLKVCTEDCDDVQIECEGDCDDDSCKATCDTDRTDCVTTCEEEADLDDEEDEGVVDT